MMRGALGVMGFLFACSAGDEASSILVGGALISLDEGDARTFALTQSDVALAADAPSWASITPVGLVLNPGCDVVPGSVGPPRSLTFQLRDHVGQLSSVFVEIHPSRTGACEPKLIACLHQTTPGQPACAGAAALGDGTSFAACEQKFEPGSEIIVDYMKHGGGLGQTFSDPAKQDKALLFHLANPDPGDALAFRVTTDAPIKVALSTPLPSGVPDRCVSVPNVNRVGSFELDYAILRADVTLTDQVSGGAWPLLWNRADVMFATMTGTMTRRVSEPYGVEVVQCAADDVGSGCRAVRYHADPQWCIERPPNTTVRVDLLLWASSAGTSSNYAIKVCAAPLDLTAPNDDACIYSGGVSLVVSPLRSENGRLDVSVSPNAIPVAMSLDFDGTVPAVTVDLKANVMGSSNDVAEYRQLTRTRILVRSSSGPSRCPLP